MFHIDLNANELHIIQSWENWKNAVLLDLARDSCVPPSLNPQSCHKDKTSADSLPAVLLLIHIEDKPGACGDWMDGECLYVHALTDCLHDEAAAAWLWRPCASQRDMQAARGDRGAVPVDAGCQVQWEAPRDEETIFAQAALKMPVEFTQKCIQLNYLQRTVHGHVDFHLFQSCSLTNISSAAPPSHPGLLVSMATHHQTKPSTLWWHKTPFVPS